MSPSTTWHGYQGGGGEQVEFRFEWEAAFPDPHTPDEYNRIGVRRYRPRCPPRGPAAPHAAPPASSFAGRGPAS